MAREVPVRIGHRKAADGQGRILGDGLRGRKNIRRGIIRDGDGHGIGIRGAIAVC